MAHTNERGIEDFPEGIMHLREDDQDIMTEEWNFWLSKLVYAILLQKTKEITLDPANVPAQDTTSETITWAGITTNDIITVNKPTYTQGISVSGFASAVDTVTLIFSNATAGAVNPPSETYKLLATRL